MKKLLFAVSALAALSLLAPSAGFAFDFDNTIGIFADEVASTNQVNGVAAVPFNCYAVLLRPAQLDGTLYATINAFEFTLTSTDNTILFLAQTLPPQAVNVGDTSNIANGLEYFVGLGADLPVNAEAVTLVSFQIFSATGNAFQLFVGPTSQPSIDGEMAFQSVSGNLVPMFSAAGDPGTGPVFGFNTSAVATEDATWGGVKALYR